MEVPVLSNKYRTILTKYMCPVSQPRHKNLPKPMRPYMWYPIETWKRRNRRRIITFNAAVLRAERRRTRTRRRRRRRVCCSRFGSPMNVVRVSLSSSTVTRCVTDHTCACCRKTQLFTVGNLQPAVTDQNIQYRLPVMSVNWSSFMPQRGK